MTTSHTSLYPAPYSTTFAAATLPILSFFNARNAAIDQGRLFSKRFPPVWFRRLGLLFIFVQVLSGNLWGQSPGSRPQVGLTLSGGGARGLAHVGLLKALDSAQVHVDYVTGTSMGAVVGALYAAGYSGNEIEKIAQGLDWNALLTNAAQLSTITLPGKDDFGRYIVELPFENGSFRFPTGVIESEELWLKLSDLFFPYYRNKNFAQFQRGFRCVATDVFSGDPEVLRAGEIVQAIRASMAIPSVFTPVQYQGHRLVDGGVVRNFPVSEVKAMGAGVVIGSNVSAGAYTENSLRNPVDVLMQISSFKDNSDFKLQKVLCNVYVDYPLGDYTSGSFSAAGPILAIGNTRGRATFSKLQTLRDSLNSLYGPAPPVSLPHARADSVYIESYQVRGLGPAADSLLIRQLQLRTKRYYTATQISSSIRDAFGTRAFRKITYTLVPVSDSSAQIVFDVERSVPARVGLGVHYNSLTSIGLIGSVSLQDKLFPSSTSQLAVNIGESPRLRLKHIQYLTKRQNVVARFLAQAEQVEITTYTARFDKGGLYKQRYVLANAQLLKLINRNHGLGVGTRYEYGRFKPEITSRLQLNGRIHLLNSYLFYESNTLNAVAYPTRGRKLEVEYGYVYGQRPDYRILIDSTVVGTEQSPGLSFKPYEHSRLNFEQYTSLTKRSTLLLQAQAGINRRYRQSIANDFVIGGLSSVIRNQITFAGLPEAAIYTGSVATGLVGYQYAVGPRIFATAKFNVLYHDFINSNTKLQPAAFVYGGAITLGINSFLGPIDASLMYSNVTKKVLPYFNIGFPFGYR
ncbi:patatin-like phospholipase family protein [Hymenobacter sp. GOD-10R]|uniref:patatin-like phospholipase family protein n=1 Tax=Hymenobacter sp. GOD-10R TaxID=3093922 RepID=UPI002D77664F|nr:patatin-like phospholipase family protein [Hymenobacter sp. GOD-10R]WRQ27519.1 patatin-like phospholipase family protein [Hymenobacter sp. GOD-10R]